MLWSIGARWGFCWSPRPAAKTSDRAASPGEPPPRVVVAVPDAGLEGDPYDLNSAAITGHALTVSVSFAGGCQEHAFTLVIGDSFAESSPVQLSAVLKHDANGDRCEAWLTETHVFDLDLIRSRYREAYGPGRGHGRAATQRRPRRS